MIPHHHPGFFLHHPSQTLLRLGPVSYHVTQNDDVLTLDPGSHFLQRLKVPMDIGENGNLQFTSTTP